MTKSFSKEDLRELFTKPYGETPPKEEKWAKYYNENVIFIDPTQKTNGLDSYIRAQDNLIKRCDDISLKTHLIAMDGDCAFVEWTMGLKIIGKEFIYPGTTRLKFSENGLIKEHRDYFDFCGPTFEPVPILGSFFRWLYARFAS